MPERWFEHEIAFRLRAPPGVLVDLRATPEGLEARFESAQAIAARVRRPRFATRVFADGRELTGAEEFVKFDIPAGASRTRIEWRRA